MWIVFYRLVRKLMHSILTEITTPHYLSSLSLSLCLCNRQIIIQQIIIIYWDLILMLHVALFKTVQKIICQPTLYGIRERTISAGKGGLFNYVSKRYRFPIFIQHMLVLDQLWPYVLHQTPTINGIQRYANVSQQ